MNNQYTKENIENIIHNNSMVLLYVTSKACGVCEIHKPRLIEMLKSYPKIEFVELEVETNIEATAQLNVFTVPAALVFVYGKEVIREARYLNVEQIENEIKRYYEMF